jgi:hypothetical protein
MEMDERSAPHRFAGSRYSLANSSRETPARFDALSAMFDRGTIRHLEDRGVSGHRSEVSRAFGGAKC